MNSITNVSPAQLRRAADIQERILDLQKELNGILGAETSGPTERTEPSRKGRKKVSAAGRARMRSAQLARWAKIKGTASSEGPAPKKKRRMSAQGLANIRAGVAKRMAARGGAKAVKEPKKKRKMTPAMRAALERAWAARRAKGKAATQSRP
jgi:hypothetical protein